jgi:hypothetical protein
MPACCLASFYTGTSGKNLNPSFKTMKNHCQIQTLQGISAPLSIYNRAWQFRKRLRRIFGRRWRYLCNLLFEKAVSAESVNKGAQAPIRPGDLVRVKSKEEIRNTLDRWNRLHGCAFMEEMWPYSGESRRVYKRIERFLDERDYLMKKCRGIVILEGVFCEGTKDFGPCDRSCFLFWREEWLERLDDDSLS